MTVPYPFMDASVNGDGGVIAWIAGLTVALIGVGYVYYGLDRLLVAGRAMPLTVSSILLAFGFLRAKHIAANWNCHGNQRPPVEPP